MKRRLHLDFLHPDPPRRGLGLALLALGAAAAVSAVAWHQSLERDVARLETSVADLKRTAQRDAPPRRVAIDPKRIAQEVAAANDLIDQLARPWDELYRELETAATPNVALLAVQPDAGSGAVRIIGEARRYADVLAYVARLEERPALGSVFLASHELRQGTGARALAFTITAEWVDRP